MKIRRREWSTPSSSSTKRRVKPCSLPERSVSSPSSGAGTGRPPPAMVLNSSRYFDIFRPLQRERYGKQRPTSGRALRLDGPAVAHHDVIGYGKPHPGSRTYLLGGEKRLKNSGPHLGRNTGAVVGNTDPDRRTVAMGADYQPEAAFFCLQGVLDNIEEHLAEKGGIAKQPGQRLVVPDYLGIPGNFVAEDADGPIDLCIEVRHPFRQFVDMGESLQVGHDLPDPLRPFQALRDQHADIGADQIHLQSLPFLLRCVLNSGGGNAIPDHGAVELQHLHQALRIFMQGIQIAGDKTERI